MRVLIFHGYLLYGTGSNVYNASLARALARLGHDVHLLCQDRGAERFTWVDALGSWEDGALVIRELRDREREQGGRITAYVPEIGPTLPVYVADRYEGFDARPFPELSDAEVEAYVEANVRAVRDVAARCGAPDASLANHLIMGPCILARAGVGPYAVKIHGSALEYTVKPHPGRFLAYAREGLAGARCVLAGSRHTAESLWAALEEPGVQARTRLGPPGVDTHRFRPRAPDAARHELREIAAALEASPAGSAEEGEAGGSSFARDPREAAAVLAEVGRSEGPWVAFVGKLIVSKGLDLLVAAWPLVRARHPRARLVVAGFGGWRSSLERLLAALGQGDLEAARELAAPGDPAEGEPSRGLRMLDAFLATAPDGYADAARAAAGSVELAGRLEHEEVAALLGAVDAVVFPSTFPESFGMVSAEAAACGALPISAAHSGLAEVSLALALDASQDVAPLLSFPLDADPVRGIADRLVAWLELAPGRRELEGSRLAAAVRERWSWEAVAGGVLAASEGRLRDLPEP